MNVGLVLREQINIICSRFPTVTGSYRYEIVKASTNTEYLQTAVLLGVQWQQSHSHARFF